MTNLTPEKYASFLSKIVFAWFDGISIKGWKRLLKDSDLWSLKKEDRCSGIVPIWDKQWEKHQSEQKGQKLSIVWPLIYAFGPAYALSAVYQFLYSTFQFASPQIVNLLIGKINFIPSKIVFHTTFLFPY